MAKGMLEIEEWIDAMEVAFANWRHESVYDLPHSGESLAAMRRAHQELGKLLDRMEAPKKAKAYS
jgi:hypothetical protein